MQFLGNVNNDKNNFMEIENFSLRQHLNFIKKKKEKEKERIESIKLFVVQQKINSDNLINSLLPIDLPLKKTPNQIFNYISEVDLICNCRFFIRKGKLYLHNLDKKIKNQNVITIQEEVCYFKRFSVNYFLNKTRNRFRFNTNLYFISLFHPCNTTYFHFIFETVIYVFMIYKKYNLFELDRSELPIFIIEKNKFNYILTKIFKNIPLVTINRRTNNTIWRKNLVLPEIKNYNYFHSWNKEHIESNSDLYFINNHVITEFKHFIKNMFVDNNINQEKYPVLVKRKSVLRNWCELNYLEIYLKKKFPNLKSVFLEDLDFVEQVILFNNCNFLVLQAGSAFINTIFMPKNTHIICISVNNKFISSKFFNDISSISNKNLHWIKMPVKKETENSEFESYIDKNNSIYSIFKYSQIYLKTTKNFLNYAPQNNISAGNKDILINNLEKILNKIYL